MEVQEARVRGVEQAQRGLDRGRGPCLFGGGQGPDGLNLQIQLGFQQVVGLLSLDHGAVGLDAGQFVGPFGLNDLLLGGQPLFIQLSQENLLPGLFLEAALFDPNLAFLQSLFGRRLGLGPQLVLGGLLRLQAALDNFVKARLGFRCNGHFRHGHVLDDQADVLCQFVDFGVNAGPQVIACGANDRVIKRAIAYADLHGLLRPLHNVGPGRLVVEIERVVLGPKTLQLTGVLQARAEDVAGCGQADALLVAGDDFRVGHQERHGRRRNPLQFHKETDIGVDAGSDHLDDAAAAELDADLLFLHPGQDVVEARTQKPDHKCGYDQHQQNGAGPAGAPGRGGNVHACHCLCPAGLLRRRKVVSGPIREF